MSKWDKDKTYTPVSKTYTPADLHSPSVVESVAQGQITGKKIAISRGRNVSIEDLIEARQERLNKLGALASINQRTNRILSGEEIKVVVTEELGRQESAYTDGVTVSLNAAYLPDFSDETLVALNGVNYHELSHILFSPRIGSDIGDFSRVNNHLKALNTLEESRAEQLLLSKYPSLTHYAEANIYTNVLGRYEKEEWGGLFPLITGRTYLPIELRQGILDMAIAEYGKGVVQEVHDIIHEYVTLVFPENFDRGKVLVEKLSAIIGKDNQPPPTSMKSTACELPTRSRPASPREQGELQEGKGNSESEDTNGKSEQDKGAQHKPATGAGGKGETQTIDQQDYRKVSQEMADLVNTRTEELLEDSSIRRDLRQVRKVLRDSEHAHSTINSASYTDRTPQTEYINLSKKFATELERLVRNNDPAWRTRVPSGKLNIQRAMNPDINAIKEAFDEWDIGNEATEIEAVILMDNSGSMGGLMDVVCSNAWVIKRAVESINGSVSSFLFNSRVSRLYSREEKAGARTIRSAGSTGGTDPLIGLVEADNIFEASKKPIKILFMLTDGSWSDETRCNLLIADMKAKGILTALVYLGDVPKDSDFGREWTQEAKNKYREALTHGVNIFRAVSAPKDMLKVAEELVKSTLVRAR